MKFASALDFFIFSSAPTRSEPTGSQVQIWQISNFQFSSNFKFVEAIFTNSIRKNATVSKFINKFNNKMIIWAGK